MLTQIEPNSVVFHPSFGLGVVEFTDSGSGSVHIKFGKDSKLIHGKVAPVILRAATEEEAATLKVTNFIREHRQSYLLDTYLQWLREAGDSGVLNVCECPKNSLWNYTCPCRTLVKLYHRFSCFKDDLVNKCGFVIDDVETESGHHKTILRKEP